MIVAPLSLCRFISVAAVLWMLAGCTKPPPPPTAQESAAIAACRSQAEQEFLLRNRSSLYQANSSLTPYAGVSPQPAAIQSLADQYSHRQMVQDCLRGASGPTPVAPTPTGH
jgi:hypothetical protein